MGKKNSNSNSPDSTVYREFGDTIDPDAPESIDLPPNQQQVRIQISRKGKGGKTVTVITGLQHSPETILALAKKLKNQCGTGGSIDETTIVIQGDHRPKLLEILLGLGYKAKTSGG